MGEFQEGLAKLRRMFVLSEQATERRFNEECSERVLNNSRLRSELEVLRSAIASAPSVGREMSSETLKEGDSDGESASPTRAPTDRVHVTGELRAAIRHVERDFELQQTQV